MKLTQARPGRAPAERIKDARQGLSDRVHGPGDAYARARGWTVAETTGRLGMGARTYRDPRFSSCRPVLAAAASAGAVR